MSLKDESVVAGNWWDVYGLEPRTRVMCPDCDTVSPEFEEVFSLVKWVKNHQPECSA